MSGAGLMGQACEMRSKVEIPVKFRFDGDDGVRPFLQIGLNLFQRSVCGLLQRNAIYNGF